MHVLPHSTRRCAAGGYDAGVSHLIDGEGVHTLTLVLFTVGSMYIFKKVWTCVFFFSL